MPYSRMPETEPRDYLADAQEAMDSYWAWEEQLAMIDRGELNASDREVQRLEDDQAVLLDRALASAATSIAESLARIADALGNPSRLAPTPGTGHTRTTVVQPERRARGRRGRRGRPEQPPA